MDTPLGMFIFLYLGMGAIFFVGLLYAIRQGDVGLTRGRKRRNLVMLLGGLAFYMVLHGLFQFVVVDL